MDASNSAGDSGIPIIDLAPLETNSRQGLEETAAKLHEAFTRVGFAYVKNHGVPQEVIDEAFEWSRKFFALPQDVKNKAPHPPYGWHHRGYSGISVEKTSQLVFDNDGLSQSRQVPDWKESFEMGSAENARVPNIWPPEDDISGFRRFFEGFYEVCYGVETKLLRAIAVGLGLDEGHLLAYHSNINNQIRLLHYPPVDEDLLRDGKVECIAAHTDFGTMTLLFQDDVGGLEVEDMEQRGKFNAAPFIAGTIVVNIGDLLMRWSNDELKSTLHRVRPALGCRADKDQDRDEDRDGGLSQGRDQGQGQGQDRDQDQGRGNGQRGRMSRARYSIPYFVCADGEQTIDCLPGSFGAGRSKKYAPIKCSEYIDMRMNALYGGGRACGR